MENHHVEKWFIELNGPSSSSQTVKQRVPEIPAIDAFPSEKNHDFPLQWCHIKPGRSASPGARPGDEGTIKSLSASDGFLGPKRYTLKTKKHKKTQNPKHEIH